jgi:hypothetical protein
MLAIAFNPDAYGAYARVSSAADFFELCALRAPIPRAKVTDYIRERNVRLYSRRLVMLDDVDDADEDDTDDPSDGTSTVPRDRHEKILTRTNEHAAAVFSMLSERCRALGDLYPFSVNSDVLRRHSRRKSTTPYDVALSISLRQAYGGPGSPDQDFEGFVDSCLRAQHWYTFPFGAKVRTASGAGVRRFRSVLTRAREELVLPSKGAGEVPLYVQDRGADILARFPPVDSRPGCRTFVIQATVGGSESWQTKISETPLASWREYIGDPVQVMSMLAIPHHIENEHLLELVKNGNGATIWDRLRLVAHRPILSPRVLTAAKRFLDNGAEW